MLLKAETLLQATRNEMQRRTLLRTANMVKERLPTHLPFTSSTFCPRLWERVFIDDKAYVYACCRHLPMPAFGCLYNESLKDAWNSKSARFWRWMTARGGLPCFDRCHLLSDEELEVKQDPEVHGVEVPYESLRHVTMLFGELCNVACTMCHQDHKSKIMLSLDLIKRSIDFTHVERITIQGGEPLAMKECKATFLYLTQELGKPVSFMTNGLLITEEWAEHIARGAPRVPISLNATTPEVYEGIMVGARWEKMLRGVTRLIEAKRRLGTSTEVAAHFTIVNENVHQIPDFIPFAKSLGFDEVNYGCDNVVPAYLETRPDLVSDIKRRLRDVLVDPGIAVDTRILEGMKLLDKAS